MCGIAGIAYRKNLSDKEIGVITNSIAHRGPDDEGFFCSSNLFLGHKRLSIIDLSSAGKQPMVYQTQKGKYTIVFNGEIYNYIEIRNQLLGEGYVFNSNTDTEVILASYDKWGIECLSKFNGMWAFVIYDHQKHKIWGSRDRFGVKPLYYFVNDHLFAFASEIKAIIKLFCYQKDINTKAIFDYLLFGYEEIEEEGFWKNIKELLPGFCFELDLNNFNLKVWRYFQLNFIQETGVFRKDKLIEYTQHLRQLVFEAIKLRLRSDVPIGSCLSGGIDSSTIVCVISDILKDEDIPQIGSIQKTFTACYTDKLIDESRFAKIVVDFTGAQWFTVYPTSKELLEDIEDLVYYQEIPFGSTSVYAQYRVMKLAKQNSVKVMLDGQGGDEIFTGYASYLPVFYRELLYSWKFFSLVLELVSIGNLKKILNYSFSTFLQVLIDVYPNLFYSLIRFKRRVKYINRDFYAKNLDRIKLYTDYISSNLNKQLFYMTFVSLKKLLRYEDRNSMRFGIEARTPFADDINLINFVFQIPSIYKIHNGYSKYLLRQSMRGLVPKQIIERKDKVGFATPEKSWLLEHKQFFIDLIKQNLNFLNQFLEVKEVIHDYESGKIFSEASFIWRVINLALWAKVFRL
ncbi:MAG: asparagine synthase (glutamine-hydrolyzing) [bacterium]